MLISNVIKRYTPGIDPRTGFQTNWALIDCSPSRAEVYRQVAANIDLLRTRAPYAYLVANKSIDFPGEWWKKFDPDYYAPFPKKQLQRGGWFADPLFEEPIETTLMAVGHGDILPYVSTLHDDWHQILCLPTFETLEALDGIVASSRSTAEALTRLLAEGGFVVSCIDFNVFKILSVDASYKEFFSDALS